MRWDGNRSVRYEARRVAWPSLDELETYPQFTGGKLTFSDLSRLKESGTLEYAGDNPPDPYDLVRVYAFFEAESGESETAVLCTHMVEADAPETTPWGSRGEVKTYSVLKALESDVLGFPLTVPAGTDAVERARELCEGHGLAVEGTSRGYALATDHTFSEDDDCLEVVNWLLSAAGYGSASATRMGTVAFAPYVTPSERPVAASFGTGEGSVLAPSVEVESDWSEAPNTVRVYYADDECSLLATAENVDPSSKASTANRRRRVTVAETATELAGETPDEKLAAAEALAESRLLDNSAEIEYCTMSHAFCGVWPGDAVSVEPVAFKGCVTSMEVSLDAPTTCETKVRRFVRNAIETKIGGRVIWEA